MNAWSFASMPAAPSTAATVRAASSTAFRWSAAE